VSTDHQEPPVIWSIAAVDCLGAAGSGADGRSAQSLGVHCATLITAVTAQNSHQFDRMEPSTVAILEAQWQALVQQTRPRAIKIGLLANPEQVNWLATKLASLKAGKQPPYVIYDPVAVSSSGHTMCDSPILAAVKRRLLPQVDLLTPNRQEAEQLTGHTIKHRNGLLNAARALKTTFEVDLLLKGGHCGSEESLDLYLGDGGQLSQGFAMTSPRQCNPNQRGTGCHLSSLIAAALALNYPIEDALVLAKACINRALAAAQPIGNAPGSLIPQGWPTQLEDFPQILSLETLNQKAVTTAAFARCGSLKLGLYPVVDSLAWLRQLLALGVRTIQLRIKDCPTDEEVAEQIRQAAALGRQYDARLFINDYWQLAIKYHAYGVHLGQEDLLDADLAQIRDAGLRLGLSTHGFFEILKAHQLNPRYIALGHIFPTQTKKMPSSPQGLVKLSRYVTLLNTQYPLVAIGGIDLARATSVAATGVGSIAAVTAITRAEDPAQAVSCLNQILTDAC